MPGGDKVAYERLRPIFEAIAAKVDDAPCVEFLGNGSAGNYVKMVHNGIEYGIMQLIAETYDIMKNVYHLEHEVIQESFEQWNREELNSFLIEITGAILKRKEENTFLVDLISDWAKSKGTGKWTSQNAMDLQVPVPVIDAAVNMRDMSKYKLERIKASKLLTWQNASKVDPVDLEHLKAGLYFAIISTYAQGLAQLRMASDTYGYGLNLETVCKIWRGAVSSVRHFWKTSERRSLYSRILQIFCLTGDCCQVKCITGRYPVHHSGCHSEWYTCFGMDECTVIFRCLPCRKFAYEPYSGTTGFFWSAYL